MHQLVIKKGSVFLMHGVTMKFNQTVHFSISVGTCRRGYNMPTNGASVGCYTGKKPMFRKEVGNVMRSVWPMHLSPIEIHHQLIEA